MDPTALNKIIEKMDAMHQATALKAEESRKEFLDKFLNLSTTMTTGHQEDKLELMSKLSQITTAVQQGSAVVDQGQDNEQKFNLVLGEFRKTTRIKEFNPGQITVDDFLEAVFADVKLIAQSKGLKLTDITEQQKITLLQARLPHKIIKQLQVACQKENKTLETVSFQRCEEILKKQCGMAIPKVTAVMRLFGPDRVKWGKDDEMFNHGLEFKSKLPSCLLAKDDMDELKALRDLIHRAAFFASIDNHEIRAALLKIPDDKADFEEFTKVATDTAELLKGTQSSSEAIKKVDGAQQDATTSVLKLDDPSSKKKVYKSWRSRGRYKGKRGRGRGNSNNQTDTKTDNSKDTHELVCFTCGGKGHRSTVCPSNLQKNSKVGPSESVATKCVDIVDTVSSPGIFGVRVANNRRGDHIDISLILNGHVQALFEFDTAAGASIMPKAWLTLFAEEHSPVLHPCSTRLDLANGQTADVTGYINVDVATSACKKNKPVSATFFVVDGPHALLGRPLMKVLFPGLYNQMVQLSEGIYRHHSDEKYIQVPATMVVAKNVPITGSDDAGKPDCANTGEGRIEGSSTTVGSNPETPGITIPPVNADPLCAKLPEVTSDISVEDSREHCKLIANAHPTLFDGKQGKAKGVKVKLTLKPGAEREFPKVIPHAKIPYGIRDVVRKEIAKMNENSTEVSGVGLKVSSQVVPVVTRKDKEIKVRCCVNYKNTINPWLEDHSYPFPTANEQIEKLAKGKYFTTLDVSNCFPHFEMDDDAQELCVYSTETGFRKPKRLPFGVKTAPAICQSYMDQKLAGIPSVALVVDDICVTGSTPTEHFRNLEAVLHRLEEAGMKLNPGKCKFYQPEVKYLGRIINKDGVRMDSSAVQAILNMPSPSSRQELQSFLGYLSYVRRHVPDLSRWTPTLSSLLKKNVKYVWTDEHQKAFQKCKELAANMATLAHYDESKELVLTTDASPVGIGACLSHRVVEGNKTFLRPIAYASRSLTQAERNYSQIEREGLAVHWGTKYFRDFLFLQHFILQTDCSALTKIFGPKNDFGGCASGRMNRWCVDLMEYNFTAQHIKGDKNKVSDSLSRLPQPLPNNLLMEDSGHGIPGYTTEEFVKLSVKCLSVLPMANNEVTACYKSEGVAPLALQGLPLTASDIAKAIREDPLYGRVLTAVRTGEFDHQDKEMAPFISVRDSLTVDAGCLLYGSRVVIPTRQQARLLFELHTTHMGVVKMKSLAREYIWWPGLNKQIESVAAKCKGCSRFKKKPPPVPLTHWPWATRPMERLHVDFAEYKDVQLLLVIDAFSKYLWTFIMGKDTTTPRLLRQLDSIFADRGLPTTVVSDNGPQFTSQKFKEHMKAKNIKHVLTPPYHPASNGLAEVAVGIVKSALRKMDASAYIPSLQEAITAILFKHRQTPTTSTGRTPFEMMDLNRVQTPMSLLHPSVLRRNESHQQQKVVNRDGVSSSTLRVFAAGENVLVYNTLTKKNDIGTVEKVVGKNCYDVNIGGRTKLVSADVMSKCHVENEENIRTDNSGSVCGMDYMDSLLDESISDVENEYYSDEDDVYPSGNVYVIPHRRQRRNEVDRLHDSLSSGPVGSRTRSGNV